jgi:hypothetical protein
LKENTRLIFPDGVSTTNVLSVKIIGMGGINRLGRKLHIVGYRNGINHRPHL